MVAELDMEMADTLALHDEQQFVEVVGVHLHFEITAALPV